MNDIVYLLCALTAGLCAFLLLRSYKSTRARILFYGGLTFIGMTLSNLVLILDKLIYVDTDLNAWRLAIGLIALLPLLFGLIWED